MVLQKAQGFTAWLNESKFAFVLVFWLGILTQQVWHLMQHPSEEAHKEQLQEKIRVITILKRIEPKIDMNSERLAKLGPEIIAIVKNQIADSRVRRPDINRMMRELERKNPGFKGFYPFEPPYSGP